MVNVPLKDGRAAALAASEACRFAESYRLWLPLAASFGAAMMVGLSFELWRRLQSRRGKDILGDELPEELAT